MVDNLRSLTCERAKAQEEGQRKIKCIRKHARAHTHTRGIEKDQCVENETLRERDGQIQTLRERQRETERERARGRR